MRTRGLVGCFLICLAHVAPAQSPPPAVRRDTQHISALLTISGGISLGSYEAGVNWGLLELFKLTARDSLRRAWNLPRYELKAMAGASAGNINGFLAAIEWCRTREPVAPEQSLFWKIWVRTGFDQLFPLARYNQPDSTPAVFSRRYFERVLFDTLRAAMRDAPPSNALDGCTIPVGVTITKLTPGAIPISRGITAVTQRYATAVVVSRQGNTLRFRAPPAELLGDGKLGALLRLPDCKGAIDPDDVFSLVEASSAFPGAFAPVSLRHQTSPGAGCGSGPARFLPVLRRRAVRQQPHRSRGGDLRRRDLEAPRPAGPQRAPGVHRPRRAAGPARGCRAAARARAAGHWGPLRPGGFVRGGGARRPAVRDAGLRTAARPRAPGVSA